VRFRIKAGGWLRKSAYLELWSDSLVTIPDFQIMRLMGRPLVNKKTPGAEVLKTIPGQELDGMTTIPLEPGWLEEGAYFNLFAVDQDKADKLRMQFASDTRRATRKMQG
jgi:hypothetical protein